METQTQKKKNKVFEQKLQVKTSERWKLLQKNTKKHPGRLTAGT